MIKDVPILVYGDVMLDVLIDGDVTRMSPEAPAAPILSLDQISAAPGGAANVALSVASMGGAPSLFGVVGNDPGGEMLRQMLNSVDIDATILAATEARTTIKVRFCDDHRQIMRLDFERPLTMDPEDLDTMTSRLVNEANKVGAVVISDYAKGAVVPSIAAKLIGASAALGLPVVVDTKTPKAPHFQGATIIKPNLKEIAAALERPEPETDKAAAECAQALRKMCGAVFVVLTRGAKGLTIAGEPGEMHFEGYPVEVVDVTGAGDAVAGALALAIASSASIVEAARFANSAGAAAVTKRGTQPPTFEEVNFFYDSRPWRSPKADRGMADEGLHGRLH